MTARTCFTWYGFANEFRGCKFSISGTPVLAKNMMITTYSFRKAQSHQ